MKKCAEGAAAFLLLLVAGSVSAAGKTPADDGIPALLKFAEQQQVAAPAPSVAEKAPPVTARPKPVIVREGCRPLTALNQTLRQQAEVIQQQADTVVAGAAVSGSGHVSPPLRLRWWISGRWQRR
ncbi:hypothetical protein [Serratia inhibens]|uniref:hypothetical protein n=1 Tax=Serratia inhibens TaxID=2338073 RepID=UPI001F38915D|nr:hypothetical protein [Serratia inhibens]